MSRHLFIAMALASTVAATACNAQPEVKVTTTTEAAAVPQAAPLTASGAPETLTLEAESETLQSAASVVRMDWVAEDGAKMFGTAGGDPAMNGLYSYIAFYGGPGDGWSVFMLGNFLDYTVLSSSAGRVDLDLHESTYNEASGEIGSRHRKVIVSWTVPAEDEAPTAITVTPAS
ncbi:hypothetical protein MMB232_01777 [Brevundimonas subvibrioides]|uniref:hypothetical protein n=1 Tax=Brevundimonas subvibrioides TaxID=74313 RepID=UPI0032D585EF